VSLFGPLLRRNILLRPGCALRHQAGTIDREFRMTFWCNDAEGIQRAMARFWGADEKDQPP
jgi:hypothetical protein